MNDSSNNKSSEHQTPGSQPAKQSSRQPSSAKTKPSAESSERPLGELSIDTIRDRLTVSFDYTFDDTAHLIEALSHRSTGRLNYERLEFLGDSILSFVISDELLHRRPKLAEGALSRLRASLVKGETLALIARELSLGSYLRLGSGEMKSGGFERDSILADTVESIIGAIYFDGGLEPCRRSILHLFASRLDDLPEASELKDSKTRLQELLQGRGQGRPDYELVNATGKSHAQEFTVECRLSKPVIITKAKGSSRRKAEQLAAELMLSHPELNQTTGKVSK